MRKAKSIQQLFEEVRGHDLVLTVDAPLATALNARLDRPRLGPWAITPQQLARRESIRSMGFPVWDDLSIISRVSRETGLDIRQVHGEVEEIRRMRRHTGRMDEFLRRRAAKRVWESYSRSPCLERAMVSFDPSFFDGKSVAVIGLDAFNDLDKHLLPPPDRFREVWPFDKGEHRIERILEMGSDREIARHVVDLIDESNIQDVAIVLNVQEPVADAVRSALYRRGIPFVNSMELRDLPGMRDLLELLELSLPGRRPRMHDLRPMLRRIGCFLPEGWDDLPLEAWLEQAEGEARRLGEMVSRPGEASYGAFLRTLVSDQDRWPVARFLQRMGLTEAPVSQESLDLFRYALENIDAGELDIPLPEEERDGVVLVDCTNSSYVDRSLVFYLGMGLDWHPIRFREEYMDAEAELDKEAMRFQVLLQQGDHALHMVKASHKGKAVSPCLLFSHSSPGGEMVRSFRELCPEGHEPARWLDDPVPPAPEPLSAPGEREAGTLSPSALGLYLSCPRRYMLSRMVSSPESAKSRFGSLVHSFAQLYASHPGRVREEGLEAVLGEFMALYGPMVEEGREEVEASRARLAMERLVSFMDSSGCLGGDLVAWDESLPPIGPGGRPRRVSNPFLESRGLDEKAACTEVSMESPAAPLRGKMDLVLAPGLGVDFKTGRGKSAGDLLKDSNPGGRPTYLDLQGPAYMDFLSLSGDREAELVFLYLLARNPEAHFPRDEEDDRATLRYKGMDRRDLIRSGELGRLLEVKKRSKTSNKVLKGDFDSLRSILMELRVWEREPGWYEDEEVLARFQESYRENKAGGLAKTVRNCHDLLYGLRLDEGAHLLLREDLEALRALALRSAGEIASLRDGVFPARPLNPEVCREACDFPSLCLEEGGDD